MTTARSTSSVIQSSLIQAVSRPEPAAQARSSSRDQTAVQRGLWGAAAVFLMLALSRVIGLTHQSLWYDEGYTVALVTAPSFHEFWLRFGGFTTSEHLQPLYYLLMFLWSRVAGTSDLAVRLPSALFSIGAGVAVWRAVGTLVADDLRLRRAAQTVGVAALMVSSFSLYYAQEGRPYALLQLLGFGLVAAWMNARSKGASGRIRLAVWAGCCALASPFTILLVGCLTLAELALWQRGSQVDRWSRWWSAWWPAVAASSFLLATYLTLAVKTMPTFIAHDVTEIRQPLWMNVGYTLYGIVYGTTLPPATSALRGANKLHVALTWWPVILPALLVLAALILACYATLRARRRAAPAGDQSWTQLMLLAGAVYVTLLFGFFGALGHLNVLPRHASAFFALLFLFVAHCGIAAWQMASPAGRWRWSQRLFVAALLGWAVVNLVSIESYWQDPASRKDDYRGTAAALKEYAMPQFVVSGYPMLLARYGAQVLDATSAGPAELASSIRLQAPQAPEIVVVFNDYRNYRWAESKATLAEAMEPDYSCRVQRSLANIEVYLCRANTAAK